MLNFESRKKSIKKQIELIKELNEVNKKLFASNQIFLHPYCQGIEIEHIQTLIKDSEDPDEAVLNFFGRKFFNLKTNLSILHGYCGKQPYLKEYMDTITRSVSLCIQHEYQGAISVLIPVIEGTLRKYLVDNSEDKNDTTTRISELLKAVKTMREKHLKLMSDYYDNEYSKNGKSVDQKEVNNLLKLDGENFDLWSEQFEIFIRDYLFRDTRRTDVIDDLNRHIITHRFKDKIDFSFKNYLRVYHSLFHLSWLINCSQPNGSPFSDPDENVVFNEYITLLNLLMLSESSRFVKERLYGEKIKSFNIYLTDEYRYAIGRSGKKMERILMRLHVDSNGKEKQP